MNKRLQIIMPRCHGKSIFLFFEKHVLGCFFGLGFDLFAGCDSSRLPATPCDSLRLSPSLGDYLCFSAFFCVFLRLNLYFNSAYWVNGAQG
jgi:hypothetical protein